jgi:putative SOS response-associated peptidase YedK
LRRAGAAAELAVRAAVSAAEPGRREVARAEALVPVDRDPACRMRGTPDNAAKLIKPYAGSIEAWEVGVEVGNVKNNRPELMERVGLL